MAAGMPSLLMSSNRSKKQAHRVTVEWSTISASGGQGGGVGPTRHPKSHACAQGWRVTSIPQTPFSQRAEPSRLWSKASQLLLCAIEASVKGEGEGSGGSDEGAREALPPVGVRRGGTPRQPQCTTLGRLAPRHYALRRRPRCPASHGPRHAARSPSHGECRLRLSTCPATGIALGSAPSSSGERDPMAGLDPGRRGPLATSSSPPKPWKQQQWYRVGIG